MAKLIVQILFALLLLRYFTEPVEVQQDPYQQNQLEVPEILDDYIADEESNPRFKKYDLERARSNPALKPKAILLRNSEDDTVLLIPNNGRRRRKQEHSVITAVDDPSPPPSYLVVKRAPTIDVTTPKFPYGKCHVSYGFKNNKDCLPAEICVDKDSEKKVKCSLGSGVTCPACSPPPAPAPPPCSRGCMPGSGCPPLTTPADGICKDPKRPIEEYEYEDTTTIEPPIANLPGSLGMSAECNTYGDTISEGKASNKEICSWRKARLECIPNSPRTPGTTHMPPTDEEIEAGKRPPGTCRCMLQLGGDNAVALQDPKTGQVTCYIPADKGFASECDRGIYPPYGIGQVEHLRREAALFCVPGAECKASEKYTGLRCMCKKGMRSDTKRGTCSGVGKVKGLAWAIWIIIFMQIVIGNE